MKMLLGGSGRFEDLLPQGYQEQTRVSRTNALLGDSALKTSHPGPQTSAIA